MPSDRNEVTILIEAVTKLELDKTKKRALRSKEYEISGFVLNRWKFEEHWYSKKNCPFPTHARGLFTCSQGEDTIIIRGYDKFFNVDEVKATKV